MSQGSTRGGVCRVVDNFLSAHVCVALSARKHGPCADQAPSCNALLAAIQHRVDLTPSPMSQGQKVNLYLRLPGSTENAHSVSEPYPSSLICKGSPVDFSTVRLLELPTAVLEVIESSNPSEYFPLPACIIKRTSLVIKPSSKGLAILNTPTKSFLLRAVDQSNSLMLFRPSEIDGFHLVHTAKEYLEVVPNPVRVTFDPSIPVWDGETMDVDVFSA